MFSLSLPKWVFPVVAAIVVVAIVASVIYLR